MISIQITNEQKAGLAIALIVLIIGNWQDISSLLVKPIEPYSANLCKNQYGYNTDIKLAEAEKNYVYIPDYDAKIFITPTKSEFQVNDNIQFYIKIEDKGIIKMKEPYFYVLLYNPSGRLQGVFPCFCGQEQSDFRFEGTCSDRWCYISNPRLPLWRTDITYTKNSQFGWQCQDYQNRFCINYQKNEYCASRNEFLKGMTDDGHAILYEFKATETGTWKIYVFLFDSEYQDRKGNLITYIDPRSDSPYRNAIAYNYAELQVSSKLSEIPSINYVWIVQKAVIAIFAFVGYYGTSKKFYKWSVKKFEKYRKELIGLLIVCAIIFLVTFLIVYFSSSVWCK